MSKNVQIFLCMPSIDVILNFENIKSAIWPLWKITKTHYKKSSCIILVTFSYLFENKIPQNSITLEFINLWKVFWLLWVNFICKNCTLMQQQLVFFTSWQKLKEKNVLNFDPVLQQNYFKHQYIKLSSLLQWNCLKYKQSSSSTLTSKNDFLDFKLFSQVVFSIGQNC